MPGSVNQGPPPLVPPDVPPVTPCWRRVGQRLSATLWPGHCLACGLPGQAGRDLCDACFEHLPRNAPACACCALPLPVPAPACGACLARPPRWQAAHAAFVYAAPIDRLLPALKFGRQLAVATLLAELAGHAFANAERPAALVPVPLARGRLRERGFDQTRELARPLARTLGLPLLDALLRRRGTRAQSGLDARARRRNLAGAFACRTDLALPAHVALFDDVLTTGATLDAATRCLYAAGVARVDAWVIARVP
jgi:ComF family protein